MVYFKPNGVVINNSTVYFNVSARILLITALAAYLISVIIIAFIITKQPLKSFYSVTVYHNENKTKFLFADSGNNLKEPFSISPVIAADNSLLKMPLCQRLIPFSSVGERGAFCFKPDKVEISSSLGSVEINDVYICIKQQCKKGEYQGILIQNIKLR